MISNEYYDIDSLVESQIYLNNDLMFLIIEYYNENVWSTKLYQLILNICKIYPTIICKIKSKLDNFNHTFLKEILKQLLSNKNVDSFNIIKMNYCPVSQMVEMFKINDNLDSLVIYSILL